MASLGRKFSKFCSKQKNRHSHGSNSHESEALSASFQSFESNVVARLNELLLDSDPSSGLLTLKWVRQCFELLPVINNAFATLLVEINYPVSKWEAGSVEEYLGFTKKLMEILNAITSSLSHLGRARLSLSHALSLVENSPSLAIEHLKAIQPKNNIWGQALEVKVGKERVCFGREAVINQALKVITSVELYLCGIVLSSLSGDSRPFLETRKWAILSVKSLSNGMDSGIFQVVTENQGLLKEVKEINDGASSLGVEIGTKKKSHAAKGLQRKLDEFEKDVDGLEKRVNELFSEVLKRRNQGFFKKLI